MHMHRKSTVDGTLAILNVHVCVCAELRHLSDNKRSYVLASHEHLPVQMDLTTAETSQQLVKDHHFRVIIRIHIGNTIIYLIAGKSRWCELSCVFSVLRPHVE